MGFKLICVNFGKIYGILLEFHFLTILRKILLCIVDVIIKIIFKELLAPNTYLVCAIYYCSLIANIIIK